MGNPQWLLILSKKDCKHAAYQAKQNQKRKSQKKRQTSTAG